MTDQAGTRPPITVGRILADLGATFLRAVVTPDPSRALDGVVIHDPLDAQQWPESPVVLAVGTPADGDALHDTVESVGSRGGAVLIVREPVEAGSELARLCRHHKLALIGLARGASWVQLTSLLRSMLAEGDVGVAQDDTLGGLPGGDLFGLANAIAGLVDAPVTIEDPSSRVLAFSGRQDEADPSRIETILERQVPQRYSQVLNEQGFFAELYASDHPVEIRIAGIEAVSMLRIAMAVRAGREVLGSIWVAAPEPLTPQRSAALRDAANLVALHLLRIRAGADASRRIRADLLSTALEGGVRAAEAVGRLGLAQSSVAVLAMGVPEVPGATASIGDSAAHLQRLSDAFAIHLTSVHPRAATALLGEVTYGLIPMTERDDGATRAKQIAEDFVARAGSSARIGIGPPARDVDGFVGARRGADRALRVLLELEASSDERSVATYADVQVESFLLDLRDRLAVEREEALGPVARLLAHDRGASGQFAETLRVWLDAQGDVRSAAAELHIHPNTLRYRLRRIEAVGGIDLSDPTARFAAQLHLRLLRKP